MTDEQFTMTVKRMRDAQNEYFKTRRATAKDLAIHWERKVDAALAKKDLPKLESEQLKLLMGS